MPFSCWARSTLERAGNIYTHSMYIIYMNCNYLWIMGKWHKFKSLILWIGCLRNLDTHNNKNWLLSILIHKPLCGRCLRGWLVDLYVISWILEVIVIHQNCHHIKNLILFAAVMIYLKWHKNLVFSLIQKSIFDSFQ